MDKPPNFFKSQFVCDLHFSEFMYKNLQQCATPSLHLSAKPQDSGTQTWEPTTSSGLTSDISELPDLKKIQVRTFQTQTEDVLLSTNHYLEAKNMQCNEQKLKSEGKTIEVKTEATEETDEVMHISTDNDKEAEDGTMEMPINNFIEPCESFKNQIRVNLRRKNVPQTPIMQTESWAKRVKVHKQSQTNNVAIYKIPTNNKCFQQCLRCGKNASRLAPKQLKPDHLFTVEDFKSACERFLSPEFCATVKAQIEINQQLIQLHGGNEASLDDV